MCIDAVTQVKAVTSAFELKEQMSSKYISRILDKPIQM